MKRRKENEKEAEVATVNAAGEADPESAREAGHVTANAAGAVAAETEAAALRATAKTAETPWQAATWVRAATCTMRMVTSASRRSRVMMVTARRTRTPRTTPTRRA